MSKGHPLTSTHQACPCLEKVEAEEGSETKSSHWMGMEQHMTGLEQNKLLGTLSFR